MALLQAVRQQDLEGVRSLLQTGQETQKQIDVALRISLFWGPATICHCLMEEGGAEVAAACYRLVIWWLSPASPENLSPEWLSNAPETASRTLVQCLAERGGGQKLVEEPDSNGYYFNACLSRCFKLAKDLIQMFPDIDVNRCFGGLDSRPTKFHYGKQAAIDTNDRALSLRDPNAGMRNPYVFNYSTMRGQRTLLHELTLLPSCEEMSEACQLAVFLL